jgi:site-specific DNA recombinase
MNKPAAIYARVSSDRQKENHTIASQTAALVDYAQANGYTVPPEWVFQDEGYSGAILVRPGLEALRDLAAQGQISAVLVYSPDRLSRKYAYQVLLAEELWRCGVELVFLKAPVGSSPEDQLLVQFQGMIAEYERAQIAERCRRGKRHRAQQGMVNVLSGAPYGYRYVRKSDSSAAYYEIIESEAQVVRMVFEAYTQQGLSINAIARMLNERQIPTRTGTARWERSTVWGLLRNPAYRGRACYGKTELRPRQRITRPLRERQTVPSRNSASHERPHEDWIEVPVPALVSEEIFALAEEQLQKNKHHSPRRTIEPTLLQGMLVCQQCGYALYRTSTQTSKQKLHYYRCLGSDGYRRLKGPVCTNRPIRQDALDEFVWKEIIRLLDDPTLVQSEIDRRRDAARSADPLRKREDELRREQTRLEKSSDRLISAYQEGLMTLTQLRQRMPELRKQAQAVESELQSLAMAAVDAAKYLQLAESLDVFRSKLRMRAETLDIRERQQILRLLVKEILVSGEHITICHSIPIPPSGSGSSATPRPSSGTSGASPAPSYLLRSGSHHSALRNSFFPARLQHHPEQLHDLVILYPSRYLLEQQTLLNIVEVGAQVNIDDSSLLLDNCLGDPVHRFLRCPFRPVSIRPRLKISFENRLQDQLQCSLDHTITDCRNRQDADFSPVLRNLLLPCPHGSIRVCG